MQTALMRGAHNVSLFWLWIMMVNGMLHKCFSKDCLLTWLWFAASNLFFYLYFFKEFYTFLMHFNQSRSRGIALKCCSLMLWICLWLCPVQKIKSSGLLMQVLSIWVDLFVLLLLWNALELNLWWIEWISACFTFSSVSPALWTAYFALCLFDTEPWFLINMLMFR